VLNVLLREGIPVDAIAGTSMGAGIGGLYAAGYSPDEIEDIFLTNDWNDIFKDTPPRAFLTQQQKEAGSRHLLEFTFVGGSIVPPSGLTAGQKLTNLLAGRTLAATFEANMNFDRLRIPFRAVATDIETGEAIPIARGLLHDAMRASAAIPVVFQPVEIEGRILVDGGMSNNLPVEIVRSMGMDVVIAVDPSSRLESKDKLDSVVSIFNQAISLQVRRETERQRKLADLLIVPNTDDYAFTDFPAMAEIIRKGEEAAREALPRIRELITPKQPSPWAPRFRITDLTVRGAVTVDETEMRQTFAPLLSPREATEQDLRAAMAEIFAAGPFAELVLELTADRDAFHAALTVRENPVVTDISISGNTLVPSAEIRELLAWQLGRPLNGARLSSELEKLTKRLRSRGYLLFRVDRAALTEDGHTLGIVISEGMVDSISYRGKTRTRRSLIQRETITRAGAPLNFLAAADDLQHLYALDYFESIDADMERSPRGGVDIRLKIKEKPTNRIRLGLRYDLEDSFTALTDIVVDNITGRGIKAYLYTRYGNYTDVTLGYTSPVFIRSNFLHTVQAFFRQRDYLLYVNSHQAADLDISRTGIDFAFGYQWFRFGDTYLRYRFVSDRTRNAIPAAPFENPTRISSLAFLSTLDTRDHDTFPRSGVLFKGSYEAASQSYGGAIDFRKTVLAGQMVLPLGKRHTLAFDASAGLGSGELPYQEQFGIGGADSLLGTPLPGYHRREFVGANELGASATYRWMMAEYQLKAVKAVYLVLSGGAANVWDRRDDLSPRDLRKGAGIGLHADTLIGPVRLDLGAGEDNRYLVYFSAGFDF
jgi:NTE family protein